MTARSDRAVNVYASTKHTSRVRAMPFASGVTVVEARGLAERGAGGFRGMHARHAFPQVKRPPMGPGQFDGRPCRPRPSGPATGVRGSWPDLVHHGFPDGKS